MASASFTLGDANNQLLVKILLAIITLGVIAIAIIVGYFVFRSAVYPGCSPPLVGPNGFSNWTAGAEVIAVACLGMNHTFLGEHIFTSKCVDKAWVPEPMECDVLPIHLVCSIDKHGLEGILHMWQKQKEDPVKISGVLSTSGIDRTKPLFSEELVLSRTTCSSSNDFNVTIPQANISANNAHDFIKVSFESDSLVAYKRTELKIIMVFIDKEKTATLISVMQDGVTLVMPRPIDPWNMENI